MTMAPDETPAALLAHGRALRALARSILGSSDGADDVVQEAYVQALQRRLAADDPRGWLARVVQNLARRTLRDRARRERLARDRAEVHEAPAPDVTLATLETHRRLADAVAALPAPLRRAIVLRFWHGLPPRAIARQLALPVATVKTHLQRGLAELRARFDREHPERRQWLLLLVPVAEPEGWAGLAAGPAPPTASAAVLALMTGKPIATATAALLVASLFTWMVWPVSRAPAAAPAANVVATAETSDDRGTGPGDRPDAALEPNDAPTVSVSRQTGEGGVARAPLDRACLVVGRIVAGDSESPAGDARLHLVGRWDENASVDVPVDVDGGFEQAVTYGGRWVPFSHALASAPGWAVREVRLEHDIQKLITNDRLDLGTLRLERGVAVSGRVVEADGGPLQERVRLLLWDPSWVGEWLAISTGRTVGFVDPGGSFALVDRISPAPGGRLLLAAIGARGLGWTTIDCLPGAQTLDPVTIRLQPGATLCVRVTDPHGRPLAGAEVAAAPHYRPVGLAPAYDLRVGWMGPPRLPEARALLHRTTDAEGRVTFVNLPLPKGPHVRDANGDQPSRPPFIVSARAPGHIDTSVTTRISTNDSPELVVELEPRRRCVVRGRVTTAANVPLAAVRVANDADLAAVTGEDGEFELPVHTYDGAITYLVVAGPDVPRCSERVSLPRGAKVVDHDIVVSLRDAVTGCVVDQHGKPVAGARIVLGIEGRMHYPSTPERTGTDGAFAFPDALVEHDHLWVEPPSPASAWRIEPSRRLSRRVGETIVLERLDIVLTDLVVTVTSGVHGERISPTDAELVPLLGETWNTRVPYVPAEFQHGTVVARGLRPGAYLLVVHGPLDLCGRRRIEIPVGGGTLHERLELQRPATLLCEVDWSGLAAPSTPGEEVLVALDDQHERSFATDASGNRLPLTPNTGLVVVGSAEPFRLERVTPDVPLRLRTLSDTLIEDVWITATAGHETRVVLRPAAAGRLEFAPTQPLPQGVWQWELRDTAGRWQRANDFVVDDAEPPPASLEQRCKAGSVAWRLHHLPFDGPPQVYSGTTEVPAGATVRVAP